MLRTTTLRITPERTRLAFLRLESRGHRSDSPGFAGFSICFLLGLVGLQVSRTVGGLSVEGWLH